MLLSVLLLGVVVIGALVADKAGASKDVYRSNRARKGYISFVCLFLGLESGLRDLTVGSDTYAYYLSFLGVKNLSWSYLTDKAFNYYLFGNTGGYKDTGYDLLVKLLQGFGVDFRVFLILIAATFFFAFGRFLYKNSATVSNSCIAFLLYLIIYHGFYSITGLRQTIAMAVCLFVFEYAKKRRPISFCVPILLVSSIHKSALLFLPVYFLIRFRRPKETLSVALLAVPLLFVFRGPVVSAITSWFGYEQYAVGYDGAGAFGYAVCALVAAIVLWLQTESVVRDGSEYVSAYITLFSVSVAFIPVLWVDPSLMRAIQYYSIFILLVFPSALNSLENVLTGDALPVSKGGRPVMGRLYLLCVLFLAAYCFRRFYSFDYTLFFMA